MIARTPQGRTISLNGFEAAYLALCRKGLKGHAPSLIKAIQIMLEVPPATDDHEDGNRREYEDLIARFEKMGIPMD